jgi:hypothetical protein
VDVRRVTVVQLATASLLSFLMVVPSGEAIPDFSWLLLISTVGLGGQRDDPSGDELGAKKCLTDSRHADLRRRTGMGRDRRADCRGAFARRSHCSVRY